PQRMSATHGRSAGMKRSTGAREISETVQPAPGRNDGARPVTTTSMVPAWPPPPGAPAAVRFATRVGGAFLTHPAARAGGDAGTIEVVVTGRAPSFLPGAGWTVSEISRAPVERFIPADRP
ncbi:hypothetical protein AB0C08_39775, partial [Microbispora bryophytorum]